MNIPGILSIEKIEFDKVSLPILKTGDTININDYLTGDLRAIDLITESPGIKVLNKTSSAGPYFQIEIPFTIAGYDSDVLSDQEFTSRKPHIYIVTEKSGLKYLIGFNSDPKAKFNYELKNDPSPKGGRSISCKIAWSTTIFPVFVNP